MSDPMDVQAMVRQFHEVFGLSIGATPSLAIGETTHRLRVGLIDEELNELNLALDQEDIVAVADALGDLAYVVFGAAITYGIDLNAVVAEIHRSNMTKLGDDGKPVRRADGKVLKGPRYEPPVLGPLLLPATSTGAAS